MKTIINYKFKAKKLDYQYKALGESYFRLKAQNFQLKISRLQVWQSS